MDDELENFIRERKARVSEDKASLEQDPPYLEIKVNPPKGFGSTAKENIPPCSEPHGKEESNSVGLPLGVEYERKKQRLQHELRMDYRRYMAQRRHFEPVQPGALMHLSNRRPVQTNLLREQRQEPLLCRDAATLTEDSRGSQRTLHPAEAQHFHPEEKERSSVPPRRRDRLGKPEDKEAEDEDDFFREELELTGGRRSGFEGVYERRRSKRTEAREKGEISVVAAREGWRSRAMGRKEDAEFTTGLIIGFADTKDALQRRKERYRQELQEQIAEQHRNRKREKDLELKVAATGANDPEKQPDRIRQFGASRRKDLLVLEPLATAEDKPSSRRPSYHERTCQRDRETSPPEQPHVAFQSPLLEYSSALGLSPSSQPAAPSFPRAVDTPRLPPFPPHPPSTLAEAYRTPYADPYSYYGSRNLLDPHTAYYGHPVPTAGLPVSYWNVPSGGAGPSHFGDHSPHSQQSGGSFPEPPVQLSSETATVDSQVRVYHSDKPRPTRVGIMSYRDALNQQEASGRVSEIYNKIQEKQERRRQEKEETERYEAQLEMDMKNHPPWGRGGGGAPLRDSTGNLIADLKQMHKLNEEAYTNPEQWRRRAKAAMSACRAELPDPEERVSGFTHVQTPQFARGNVFANQPSHLQLQEQEKYKAYLKQQIDEKMLKKAEERERTRLEEEKEEKRLAEQRARIQKEYEEEQERKKRKEMEQKAKDQELIQLTEQRRKEAERKKKEVEEKQNAELRRQYERERQARVDEVCREPSPPIPTLQKRHGLHQYTPRPPTGNSLHSAAPLSERSMSGLQSPPVPACWNQLRAAGDQHKVFSELSALRRQLRSEQKRLEGRLQQGDWEDLDSPLSDRHQERLPVDVFDMARLRLQAPVRRPMSRNAKPRNLLRIHDSLQLKSTDGESRLGYSDALKLDGGGAASRRRRDYRDPYHQFSSQRVTVHGDYRDLSPPQQNDFMSARGSLLESESAFMDPLGEAFPVPRTPEREKTPLLSARERRRAARESQRPQERAAFSQPFGQQDHLRGTRRTEEAEFGMERRRTRTGGLSTLGHHGNPTEPADLSDDSSSPPHFSLRKLSHHSSVETLATDPWMRPGTSDSQRLT